MKFLLNFSLSSPSMAAINTGWILCVFSLCFGSVSQALHSAHIALEAQAVPFIFNELCVMKEDAGPCKAMKDHFFFDIDTGRCRLFEYGGCGGNDNNFQTMEACEQTCLVPADKSPCNLEEAPGPCRGLVTRYFFNRVSRECQQFYYGGCFGNANNFRSIAECQAKCQNPAKATKEPVAAVRDPEPTNSSEIQPLIIKEVTSLPKVSVRQPAVFSTPSFCLLSTEEGPCQANYRRFAYNPLTQECSSFRYGGCEGNKNNFVYKRHCMKICMNVHHHRTGTVRIKRKNISRLNRY